MPTEREFLYTRDNICLVKKFNVELLLIAAYMIAKTKKERVCTRCIIWVKSSAYILWLE